jgi:hypothetical protein
VALTYRVPGRDGPRFAAGTEKGKPFAPDARMKKILTAAEVPLCEGPAKPGLQVTSKAQGFLLGRKLDDDDQGPGAVVDNVPASSLVKPLQPIVDVARHTDAVMLRVIVAAKDVHEALADSVHRVRECTARASMSLFVLPGNISRNSENERTAGGFCNARARTRWKRLLRSRPGAFGGPRPVRVRARPNRVRRWWRLTRDKP